MLKKAKTRNYRRQNCSIVRHRPRQTSTWDFVVEQWSPVRLRYPTQGYDIRTNHESSNVYHIGREVHPHGAPAAIDGSGRDKARTRGDVQQCQTSRRGSIGGGNRVQQGGDTLTRDRTERITVKIGRLLPSCLFESMKIVHSTPNKNRKIC
jgi:hypothetical protein